MESQLEVTNTLPEHVIQGEIELLDLQLHRALLPQWSASQQQLELDLSNCGAQAR